MHVTAEHRYSDLWNHVRKLERGENQPSSSRKGGRGGVVSCYDLKRRAGGMWKERNGICGLRICRRGEIQWGRKRETGSHELQGGKRMQDTEHEFPVTVNY